MNGIDDLATFICRLQPEHVTAPVMEKLKLHVVDTLGAWIAAARTAEGRALVKFRHDLRSFDQAPATKRNLFDDLTTNCALVRLSEIDDIHLASMTTAGAIVIPAATTIAASLRDPDVGDVAAAVIGGYEAMIRLAAAIKGPDILYRGIWPTYFTASFGSAAVAARLLRLDQSQTEHALALALTMAAPSVGQHHAATTSRWFSVGNAARNGLTAALAARAGFSSDVNVLQSRLLSDVFAINPDLYRMLPNAGEPALMQVSFKPWCAARQTMAATQGLHELMEAGIAAADIQEIVVSVLPPHLKMIDHRIRSDDRASHLTSLPYQMAVAALQPAAAFDISQSPATVSDALQTFMERIKVTADDTLLADYPVAWPARVVITTPSGKRERIVRYVPGDPARPFTIADVGRKFQRVAAPILEQAGVQLTFESAMTMLQSKKSLLSVMQELDHVAG